MLGFILKISAALIHLKVCTCLDILANDNPLSQTRSVISTVMFLTVVNQQ